MSYRFAQFTCQVWPLYLEKSKKSFLNIIIHILQIFTLSQKKINNNCCTAALAVQYCCLILPIVCIALVLRLGYRRYRRSWCWYGYVEACGSGLLRHWAEFQHRVVYFATDLCLKRLEACTDAEGGHSEHLLWRCLPDIPVATHHYRFFSEPPTTTHNWLFLEPPAFERTQQTFSLMKKLGNLQASVVTFSGGGKRITVCFLLR